MKSKDILNKLNDEVSKLVDDKPSANITATPINVVKGSVAPNPKPKRSFVHSRAFQAMCACMVCVAVLVGVLVPVLVTTQGVDNPLKDSTYVTMDINPSIDYVVDKDNKVVNVMSRNNDGDLLLSHGFKESVVGKSIEDAVDMTLGEATKLGFIDAKKLPTDIRPSAVRIMVSSDKTERLNEVLTSTKSRAESHLKANGIYMVVVAKGVAKDIMLGTSGLKSIDELSKMVSEKDSYHYINNVENKTAEEIISTFKSDFAIGYMEDAFDELIEDIDDAFSYITDIDDIEQEIREIEREEGLLPKDYWLYKINPSTNKDIMDKVEEIDSKIESFNKGLEDSDDDDIIDIGRIFDSIDSKIDLDKTKALYKVYTETNVETKLENIFDKISETAVDIDKLFGEIDNVFGVSLGKIGDAVRDVSKTIKAKIDEVANATKDYYQVCREQIDRAYNNLVKRNEGNSGNGTIDDETYREFVESVLEDYADIDDFWDDIHK